MPAISEDQVIALAPDDNSVKSAQELASSDRWFRYGAGENTVWGECPGSGGRPYQTCIDIAAPAFKCSCPGRKFPCKHGLGLLLFFCRFPEAFVCRDIPDWAGHWLQSRRASQEKKTEKSQELSARIPDFQARDRRKSERLAKVESGLSEFRLWVQDRIRQGLSGLESQSYQFWERAAARLTDAQAPGLARQLRQCAGIANSGQGWQARLLCRLCLLHSAAEGFTRLESLDENLQYDLRSLIGFVVSQEEVLRSSGIRDCWQILAQRQEIEDRLKIQRTWLRGLNTGQWALVLNFAYGMQPLDMSLSPGYAFEAELVFFPSGFKQRALVKTRLSDMSALQSFAAYQNSREFLEDYADALAGNPWLESFPVSLKSVVAGKAPDGNFYIIDREKSILPVKIGDSLSWRIMALTGGHPFSLVGEWNGETFLPLSLLTSSNFYRLDVRTAADGL